MSFGALPKDLLWLLMARYFDPNDALRCLRVCKRLNECIKHDIVLVRVIKARALLNSSRYYMGRQLVACKLCNMDIDNYSMWRHLALHERHPEMFAVQRPRPEKCRLCDIPFPDSNHANMCLMEIVNCTFILRLVSFANL
jgi:hypothetical protein